MTRKTSNKVIGKALGGEMEKRVERLKQQAANLRNAEVMSIPSRAGRSVLEESNLDELIATVELRKEAYAEVTGEAEYVQDGPTLVIAGAAGVAAAERAASERRDLVSIPRRPQWTEGMSVEELSALEAEAFMEWRRGLAHAAQEEGLFLTPYERNLDFWRQLWRCIERSDLLVQIVDARDPDFYHCRDLQRYVEELGGGKRVMLLANKADFLPRDVRAKWAEHFRARGVDVIFFSALHELLKQQQRSMPPRTKAADQEAEAETADAASSTPSTSSRAAGKPQAASQEAPPVVARGAADGAASAALECDAAVDRDPVEVPVPGLLDSDDDLAEGIPAKATEGQGEHDEGDDDDDDQEGEGPLGALAVDDTDVADTSRLLEELCARLPAPAAEAFHLSTSSGQGVRSGRRGTIGFVGYPNVGKSTVINALVGAKRVGMSKTPGKTKHIQTLELQDVGVTLCDCPGLVFPSVAATKAHLVINNTVPIDDLRECFSPVALILQKVGFTKILDRYDCAAHVKDARLRSGDHVLDDAHAFLAALAVSRNHLLRVGVPDENWAARKVLRDYVSGALLHCELPPPPSGGQAASPSPAGAAQLPAAEPAEAAPAATDGDDGDAKEEEDDFGDLDSFLKEARSGTRQRGMTKRRMRQMNKQMLRGGVVVEAANNVGVNFAACHRGGVTA